MVFPWRINFGDKGIVHVSSGRKNYSESRGSSYVRALAAEISHMSDGGCNEKPLLQGNLSRYERWRGGCQLMRCRL